MLSKTILIEISPHLIKKPPQALLTKSLKQLIPCKQHQHNKQNTVGPYLRTLNEPLNLFKTKLAVPIRSLASETHSQYG